jgi:hypothetical protein
LYNGHEYVVNLSRLLVLRKVERRKRREVKATEKALACEQAVEEEEEG